LVVLSEKESLLSQTLVVHLLRTAKVPFFQSRPSLPLLLSSLAVVGTGMLLPQTHIGAVIGMKPLPGFYDLWLLAVLVGYGVLVVPRIRMRHTGGEWFSDVVVLVDPGITVEEAHEVADAVEASLGRLMPGGDVTVHTEPFHAPPVLELLTHPMPRGPGGIRDQVPGQQADLPGWTGASGRMPWIWTLTTQGAAACRSGPETGVPSLRSAPI